MESKLVSSSLTIGRLILSVVLGIALGLTITLNLGSAWWQVVIASAISGIIGACIAETKAVRQVAARSLSWFQEEIRKTPEIIESAGKRLPKFQRIESKTPVSLHAVGFWLNWEVLFVVSFLFLLHSGEERVFLVLLLSSLSSWVFARLLFFTYADPSKERECFLWCPLPFNFSDPKTHWVIKEGTILGTLASCLGAWVFLWSLAMMTVTLVGVLIFFALLWLSWGIFALIRLPLVITAFSRDSKVLEVFASIAIGVIGGTIFHSYWWGWGIGLGFLGLTFLPEIVREKSFAASQSYREWICDTWN